MKKATLLVTVLIFAGLFAVLLYEAPAHALPIWGSDASEELTGSRNSLAGEGVDATQQWDNGGFTIEWDISQGSDDLWTYIYTVTADTKDLSHFILEVTDDEYPFNIFDGTSLPYEGPYRYDSGTSSSSNPLMPNPIYGVKFDFGDTEVTYTMVTDSAPVYGVFYTKDGKDGSGVYDVVAWSTALNSGDYKVNESLTTTDFIVRPDGAPIPEPSTVLLVGTGLLGIIGFGRKRLNKKA